MNIRSTIYFIHRHYKLIITAIGIILALSLFFTGTASKDRNVNASTHNEKYFKCITIEEDDTLWSIAGDYISEEYDSIDDYIQEVMSINNLSNEKIYCGATLVIPYYASPK